jgi:hypothetical protein
LEQRKNLGILEDSNLVLVKFLVKSFGTQDCTPTNPMKLCLGCWVWLFCRVPEHQCAEIETREDNTFLHAERGAVGSGLTVFGRSLEEFLRPITFLASLSSTSSSLRGKELSNALHLALY